MFHVLLSLYGGIINISKSLLGGNNYEESLAHNVHNVNRFSLAFYEMFLLRQNREMLSLLKGVCLYIYLFVRAWWFILRKYNSSDRGDKKT